jgi:hypothetical protein
VSLSSRALYPHYCLYLAENCQTGPTYLSRALSRPVQPQFPLIVTHLPYIPTTCRSCYYQIINRILHGPGRSGDRMLSPSGPTIPKQGLPNSGTYPVTTHMAWTAAVRYVWRPDPFSCAIRPFRIRVYHLGSTPRGSY